LNLPDLKSRIIAEIDAQSETLIELSRSIHACPELGFEEVQASQRLTGYLKAQGFKIKMPFCDFPTAFRAVYGRGRPVIAFLAEYDALPGLGHACGHNLIAAAAVAAGTAARLAVDACGGTVQVIGTPAEELYAGKEAMAQQGAFNNLDAAMMVHPGGQDLAALEALACQRLDIEFTGRAAHAAGEPQSGINALEAMILAFNAIDALRQHLPPKGMVHGIITDGGAAANIVPAHSAGNFIVRAADLPTMELVKQKVLDCFKGAAVATGAKLNYQWEDSYYAPLKNNLTICRTYVRNIKLLGRKIRLADPNEGFGSTDFGNVSQLVPGMHSQVGIAQNTPVHSPEFAAAAVTEQGFKGMLQASQGLAMTAAELFFSPELLKKAKNEFASQP
jgi:amidohydrolase